MKLISLNVGTPRSFDYKGNEIYTSIFKYPVGDERRVSFTNVEGDEQSDLQHHGGALKAVYAYDVSYYQHWKNLIEIKDWTFGLFGENLTTEGLPDSKIFIGNIYRIGSVILKAIQPRFPCFKLNIRFDNEGMVKQFMQQERNGTYFSVEQEGTLRAGDPIELIEKSAHTITIQQLVEAYNNKGKDRGLVKEILKIDFLPERLVKDFESYLD